MKRSTVINNSNDSNQRNENNKQQRKHSLEDSGCMTKLKKRRHLSPNHTHSLTGKRKSKKRSSLNHSTVRTKNTSQRSRVSLFFIIIQYKLFFFFCFIRNLHLVVIPFQLNI